jgi:hypothetical protein
MKIMRHSKLSAHKLADHSIYNMRRSLVVEDCEYVIHVVHISIGYYLPQKIKGGRHNASHLICFLYGSNTIPL